MFSTFRVQRRYLLLEKLFISWEIDAKSLTNYQQNFLKQPVKMDF